jgi:hypothetical protein
MELLITKFLAGVRKTCECIGLCGGYLGQDQITGQIEYEFNIGKEYMLRFVSEENRDRSFLFHQKYWIDK